LDFFEGSRVRDGNAEVIGEKVDSSCQCDKSEEAARQTFLFRRKPLLPVG
jgi:hypothetical protein